MPQDVSLYDLQLQQTLNELNKDQIFSSNPELENSVRGVVSNATSSGVDNLGVVFVDSEPTKIEDLDSFARQLLDLHGGTIIVRSPGQVAVASDNFSRAAITEGSNKMMEVARDYPLGLQRMLDSLHTYAVPWTIYSLAAAALIIILFIALIAVWWAKGSATPQEVKS